jgi:hypothetical protein
VGVAHHHVLDGTAAVDQHADLAPGVVADLGELSRQLVRQHLVGRYASPEQTLKLTNLAGLETERIAKNLDKSLP